MGKVGIYKITNPVGFCYIGQSSNLSSRMSFYKMYKNDYFHLKKVKESLLKHGYENHKFEIIEICTKDLLNERERFWQEYYDSVENGLNCMYVGTKDKKCKREKSYSERQRQRMLGSKHSQETKDKMSKSKIGRKFSEESIEKMRKSKIGRAVTEQTKSKIGQSKRGNKNRCIFVCGVNCDNQEFVFLSKIEASQKTGIGIRVINKMINNQKVSKKYSKGWKSFTVIPKNKQKEARNEK